MPIRHGQRYYAQVLLQPARYKLLENLAKERGIRPTALIREFTYNSLERELPASVYKRAEAEDDATWRQTILNRVEGRRAARTEQAEAESETDATL